LRQLGTQIVSPLPLMSFSKKVAPLFGTVYPKKHNGIIAR
jgi:hypothetical protein